MRTTGFFSNFLEKIAGKSDKSSGASVETQIISLRDVVIDTESTKLSIDTYALFTAVEMLANLMANCEIKTYENGVEKRGLLWAKLNFKPNVNQGATPFWREFYRKLLYDGQVLVFESYDGQWIIADGFNISDYEIKEKYFTDVYRGSFQARGSFPMSEVIYINYPNESVAALRAGLLRRYDSLIAAAAESYESGSGQKVFLNIPGAATGDPKFEDRYKDLMENRFKSFFKKTNAVLPLWNGMQASFSNTSNGNRASIDDITKLTADSMIRAAQALKMSPALITGEIAGIKEALNLTLTTAIDPLANASSEQLSTCFYSLTDISKGSQAVVDTSNIKHVDMFDIASSVDKLISSGFASPDETRGFAGLQKIGDEAMNKHYLTKNYSTMETILETGGEE